MPRTAAGQHAALYQICGEFPAFFFMHFPAHRIVAEDIFDQVQLVEVAFNRSRQPRHVPRLDLIRRRGRMAGRLGDGARQHCPSSTTRLSRLPQYAVEARFRGKVAAFIGQHRRDMTRWQAAKPGAIANGQNPMMFFHAQFIGRLRTRHLWLTIRHSHALMLPAIPAIERNASDFTSPLQRRTVCAGFPNIARIRWRSAKQIILPHPFPTGRAFFAVPARRPLRPTPCLCEQFPVPIV